MAGRRDQPHRDLKLIAAVVRMVRIAAHSLAILVCVDGLASYVTAFARVFRDPVRTGRGPAAAGGQGRAAARPGHQAPRRAGSWSDPAGGAGTAAAIAAVLTATGTGTGINTAYIERLNATFRGACGRWCAGAGRSSGRRR